MHCFKLDREVWVGRIEKISQINCCSIGDIDNDGKKEIVIGCWDETLRCFSLK